MNEELRDLGSEYHEYRLETSPTTALMMGDHRYDDRMEEASLDAENEHIGRLRAFAARGEAVGVATLDAQERISKDVLVFVTSTEASDLEMRSVEMDVNPAIGFHRNLPVAAPQYPIIEPAHGDALVRKYEAIGRYIDQCSQRLREGVARRHTPIDRHAAETATQLGQYLDTPLSDDALLRARVPESFDAQAEEAWKDRLSVAIRNHIRPAFRRQRDVILEEVLPAARPADEPGLCWLDDGDPAYARAIHRLTSLAMDPREIHEIGLRQIDQLSGEYLALGAQALGTDNLEEMFTGLRDNPDLHFDDGPSVVSASQAAMENAKREMGNWFGRLPESDCLVMETESGPTAFYFRPAEDGSRPGIFFVNTENPSRWGKFEIESMSFHEGIPGHHLQIAIAQELEGIPEFRKHAWIPAYSEGWGLYAERLADEMGLYTSTLDRIGMLSSDSMRAGRLVVDTGIHALGWSRQEAINYLAANSPMSISTIEGEVDRYIGWPGQALSYMIGRLEIQKLRVEAEAALGTAFDIKAFHDTVIGAGMLPLETLGRVVRDWVTA
jgi:uncharacterized protein (DUF885 family)